MTFNIFRKKYLDKRHLSGFNNYKYACIDNSPISVYISHPFWNWIVEFYPRWIAPNVLTFSGAMILLSSFAVISIFDYDLNANSYGSRPAQNIPNWVWLYCAIATFLAHLLDGTDGKQARRTGSSGPVGELFDHGFDSWSTVPLTITIFSAFGRGEYSISTLTMLALQISVQLVFICSHWEKYNTGVLFLSWGYDASQYGLMLFYMIAFFNSPGFFHFTLFGWSLAHFVCTAFFVSCALSLMTCVYNIYHSYAISKTGKHDSISAAMMPMFSPSLLFIFSLVWGVYSPNRVLELDPRAFFWLLGVVFSNIAVHLIIAQMSSTTVPLTNSLLTMYLIISFLSLNGIFASFELCILRIAAILFTILHVNHGICVINQLCDHFNIQPLSLKYLQKQH